MRYRNLIVEKPGPDLDPKDLRNFEQLLGCALPNDYRAFLSQFNGGSLHYEVRIDFEDGQWEYLSFSRLYPLADGSWSTNPFELAEERKRPEFPGTCVTPIACDGGGSILYLDLRSGCKVVAYVEGLPAWTGLREQDTLVPVANSFDDYLSKLTISDELASYHITSFKVTDETAKATAEWLDSAHPTWRSKFGHAWNARVPFAPV